MSTAWESTLRDMQSALEQWRASPASTAFNARTDGNVGPHGQCRVCCAQPGHGIVPCRWCNHNETGSEHGDCETCHGGGWINCPACTGGLADDSEDRA